MLLVVFLIPLLTECKGLKKDMDPNRPLTASERKEERTLMKEGV